MEATDRSGSKPGRPRPRLLVYIDVLGFKEKILNDDTFGWALPMAHFRGLMEDARKRKVLDPEKLHPVEKSFELSTFSDALAISCAADATHAEFVVGIAQSICTSLWASGSYTRGAVTLDSLHHMSSAITGRGLVEAHLLEREVARYPRILVTDQAADLLMSSPRNRLQLRDDFCQTTSGSDPLTTLKMTPSFVQ